MCFNSCKVVCVEPIEGSKVKPDANEEEAGDFIHQVEKLVHESTFCERNTDLIKIFKTVTIVFRIFKLIEAVTIDAEIFTIKYLTYPAGHFDFEQGAMLVLISLHVVCFDFLHRVL